VNEYQADDNWSIETIEEGYYLCFINPGHTGENVKIPVTKAELDYALQEPPNFDQMMGLLKTRKKL
jgi:hypothetical protein